MIDLGLLQRPQPVIDPAVDIHHLGVSLDEINRRQETRPLQAILVQQIRHDIGRGDQRDTMTEQLFHQAAKNHRIGNIGHKEFVKTQYAGFISQPLRDDIQRILFTL